MSKEPKTKKPIYKKWWVWVLAVIILIIVVPTESDEEQAAEPTAAEVNEETEPAEEEAKEEEEPAVDVEEEVEEEQVEEEEEPSSDLVGLNESLKVGDVVFTANGTDSASSVGGEFLSTDAKGTFLIVEVNILNEGNDSITVDSSFFKLKSGEVEYSSDSSAGIYANDEADFFLTSLNPGLDITGLVVFDVPDSVINGDEELLLNVQTGFFGTQQGEIKIR
ncbi:hypothetical protein BTS2_0723 [Bacillus sp. TS-2]|nr:hypothetical protein BTS2_0723 [Bacillus sp. TS-2]